jgi:50S ribosomal protein L16 3-hydroxylase
MNSAAPVPLLGGRDAASFLARFWQKRALLVRSAIPDFGGVMTPRELMALAGRDDVESRLVMRDRGRYALEHGPFPRSRLRALPARNWTLLVQGVNIVHPAADALLRRFAFIPFARLDDLMASYAVPGGGVGPHFDSYDVFLIQGTGHRRWRYGRQRDLSLVAGAPLRILRRFAPRNDAILRPGDMLYLPPQYAHDGVALDGCVTYSVGFRAASAQALAEAFLDFLRDDVALAGRYADPDLRPARHPAYIDAAMRRRTVATLARIRWDRRRVERFLGAFLTEPKPLVVFERPVALLRHAVFAARIARRGLALDRATQILYDDVALYVNGRAIAPPRAAAPLRRLADRRALTAAECARLPTSAVALLHDWYRHGFVHIAGS